MNKLHSEGRNVEEMKKFEIYFLNDYGEFEIFEEKKSKFNKKEQQKKKRKCDIEKNKNGENKKKEMLNSSIILQNCSIDKWKQNKLVKPNVYEGGYVIWECTWILLKFLYRENISFKKKLILELGCGSGLVGIYILKNRGRVVFQELNKEVINDVLLPNIKQNLNIELKKEKLKEKKSTMAIKNGKTKCFIINKSWDKLNKKLEEKRINSFDYIFGSEILYRYENYDILINILEKCLKRGGKAFFSSKSFYFGFDNGTGSRHFTSYLNSNAQTPLIAKIIQRTKHTSVYTNDIIEISHKE